MRFDNEHIFFYSLSMKEKFGIYFFSFLFFIGINLLLTARIYGAYQKSQVTRTILNEIDATASPHDQFRYSSAPFVAGAYESEVHIADGRVANLKSFFRKHGSELYNSAEKIVVEADKNGFDYRLLAAIGMQESNLCRYTPPNSYNCWGWGIYGDTVTRFSSYDEAIETVSEGIKKEYIDKGLTTATKIMEKYTPSSNGSWAYAVNHFLGVLQ